MNAITALSNALEGIIMDEEQDESSPNGFAKKVGMESMKNQFVANWD